VLDERKNVIASIAKQSLIVLFVATFFSSCTDYVQQVDDRYGEWESSEPIVKSSSSRRHSALDPESSSSAVKSSSSTKASSSSVAKSSSSKKTISSSSVAKYSSSWSEKIMTDSRDGQKYKTVKIGEQIWMAQNLNYKTENSYCYNYTASYCSKYGRLYTWAAAMDSAGTWTTNGKGCGYNKTCSPTYPVRGVCPSGWHLPSKDEWNTLFTAVGGQSTAGKVLKSTSGWNYGGNGTDAFSFSALPAGYSNYNDNYTSPGLLAYFWSSTEGYSDDAFYVYLVCNFDNAYLYDFSKNYAFSVRCLQD